jgi:hypothetical protein
MEEPLCAALQREVQRKLGKCLIRIQQYELLLKDIVGKREISGILGDPARPVASNASAIATNTMGQLVDELTEKVFQPTLEESGQVPTEAAPIDEDEHPAGWVRFQMKVSMPPEAHAQLKLELQDLVDLRNDLVHHFVEGQDLMSEEGCITAEMFLDHCYAEIERHYVALQGRAASMNEAKLAMAAFVTSPEYLDRLRAELFPETAQREAVLPKFIELLQRAEAAHVEDGWTALSHAIAFIEKEAPDATPKKHTFRGWPHVLNEARLFDVRRGAVAPGGSTETLYRSRAHPRGCIPSN